MLFFFGWKPNEKYHLTSFFSPFVRFLFFGSFSLQWKCFVMFMWEQKERERVRRDKERDHDKKLRERWNVDRAAHSLTHSSYTLSLSGRKRKDHRDVLTSATDRSLWGRHTRVLLTRRESDIHLSVRGVCLSLSCSCVWERERVKTESGQPFLVVVCSPERGRRMEGGMLKREEKKKFQYLIKKIKKEFKKKSP